MWSCSSLGAAGVAGALVASCGYGLAEARLPGHPEVTRVAVPVFVNRTIEAGAEASFADALRRELAGSGLVVVNVEAADATVAGTIQALNTQAVAFPVAGGAVTTGEWSVVVELRIVVTHAGDGRVLYDGRLAEREEYLSAGNAPGTEARRRIAIAKLGTRLAREARLAMSWAW